MKQANQVKYLVVEKSSLKAPSYHMAKNGNVFDTPAGALRSCAAINRKISLKNARNLRERLEYAGKSRAAQAEAAADFRGDTSKYVVMDSVAFAEADIMVVTYNMLNPKGGPVMIHKSQLGGCCDPATETYHCM
jgi:hypothetical protein